MKFGKQLKVQCVKAWQEHYMSYKRLKRIINKLSVYLKEKRERDEQQQLQPQHQHQQHQQHHAHHVHRSSASSSVAADEQQPLLGSARHSAAVTPSHHGSFDSRDPRTPTSAHASSSSSSSSSAALHKSLSSYSMHGETNLDTACADARSEFFAIYENDVDKVNRFFRDKLYELEDTLRKMLELTRDALPLHPHSHAHGGNDIETAVATATGTVAADATTTTTTTTTTFNNNNNNNNNNASSTTDDRAENISPRSAGALPSSSSFSRSRQQLDERAHRLEELYRETHQLLSFSALNFDGLRKIMKKYDKNTGEDGHQEQSVERLQQEFFVSGRVLVSALLEREEELYLRIGVARGLEVRDCVLVLRRIKKEVENPPDDDAHESKVKPAFIALSLLACSLFFVLPLLPVEEARAQRCLGLLSLVTVLWVTEAIPFFVTSLAIPFVVVLAGILADPTTGVPLSAERASKAAFASMFNDTIMLILGGFCISAAFSKCQFELRLAAIIQRRFGSRPTLFLLAFMMLGAILSMWISNVAAPVLLTSLLLPIVRDFGATNSFARALMLGLAMSCNIGGMMSPISSPQNAVALGFLETIEPEHAITFGQWMSVSLPYCFTGVLLSWLYLVHVFLRNAEDIPDIPTIVYERAAFTRTHVTVIVTSLVTVMLWCSLSYTRPLLGEMGTIAVIPFVVFFGTGVLNKSDLAGFQWHLVLLVGGGSVLGSAVNSSQLLHILSEAFKPYLLGQSLYVTVVLVLSLVFIITTFVSHTVAALILSPLIIKIGAAAGNVQLVSMSATLMMSATMSLPTSSFPNMNSLAQDDDFSRNFVHATDFLMHGSAIAVTLFVLVLTLGYAVMSVVFTGDASSAAAAAAALAHAAGAPNISAGGH